VWASHLPILSFAKDCGCFFKIIITILAKNFVERAVEQKGEWVLISQTHMEAMKVAKSNKLCWIFFSTIHFRIILCVVFDVPYST